MGKGGRESERVGIRLLGVAWVIEQRDPCLPVAVER